MRVLYVDGDDTILKEIVEMTVGGGQIVLEATSGDKRHNIVPHHTWTHDDLVHIVTSQGAGDLIDLRSVVAPKP